MSTQLRLAPADSVPQDGEDLPLKLPLEILVRDRETIAELCAVPDGDLREEFALKALRIGVMALRQARGQIDAELVRREGDRLLLLMQSRLEEHSRTVHDRTAQTLKEYFDPQSGRFQERVDRLVRRDGELEQVLRRQLGQDDSELTKTLSQHFGQESELIKWLNPDQSQGLLGAFRCALDEQLALQRDHVLKQFSLDNKEGALARFIHELTNRQGELTEQLQGQIETIVKEFSLDEENSALSRLVANVDRAQRTITREFSLDADDSSLARLKREMFVLIETQRDQNQKFQEEVKLALQTMLARKQEAARSTRHGVDFEASVLELVAGEAQKSGDVFTATGNSVGRIKNCKKGDGTLEFGPESAAPGTRIVIEAKEDASYQLNRAREEIEEARKNRGADAGLFIFSRTHAPSALESIFRMGDDVFVVWDPEDSGSDLYLKLGVSLARALAVRHHQRQSAESADYQAIEKAILDIEKAVNGLDELETSAGQINSHGEKMLKRIGLMRRELNKQIEVLRGHTLGLKEE